MTLALFTRLGASWEAMAGVWCSFLLHTSCQKASPYLIPVAAAALKTRRSPCRPLFLGVFTRKNAFADIRLGENWRHKPGARFRLPLLLFARTTTNEADAQAHDQHAGQLRPSPLSGVPVRLAYQGWSNCFRIEFTTTNATKIEIGASSNVC